jgi:hypothetical protein
MITAYYFYIAFLMLVLRSVIMVQLEKIILYAIPKFR